VAAVIPGFLAGIPGGRGLALQNQGKIMVFVRKTWENHGNITHEMQVFMGKLSKQMGCPSPKPECPSPKRNIKTGEY
jgi:hypothetical protein